MTGKYKNQWQHEQAAGGGALLRRTGPAPVKALAVEPAGAKEQLAASGERLNREIEQRRRTEEALKERLQFERLLSDLSARFINIAPDQVDSEIQSALRQILEFFQVDRCGLVRISPTRYFISDHACRV